MLWFVMSQGAALVGVGESGDVVVMLWGAGYMY